MHVTGTDLSLLRQSAVLLCKIDSLKPKIAAVLTAKDGQIAIAVIGLDMIGLIP